MPAKILFTSPKVDKQLSKIPLKANVRVVQALRQLKQNPLAGAKLGGELFGNYKFRVGDYRIVYKFDAKESRVDVVKIEHRQGIYR